MSDHPRWSVKVLVKRYVTITVEAASATEALAEAEEWRVVGEEVQGDTMDFWVIGAEQISEAT